METYYPIVFVTIALMLVGGLAFGVITLINKFSDFETKLTGIWMNESKTLRIILHHIDSVFQGEIVWLETSGTDSKLLGFRMVKDLIPKKFNLGIKGVYVDPATGMEHPVRLWWLGKNRIKFDILSKINGQLKVIKREIWHQI